MSDVDGPSEFPHDFAGVVRLFPLPNLVFFPHVVQPLRLFEPRYRALMEEAMECDHLISMGLLLPGWEKAYFQRPAIAETICIGRVIAHRREKNGDYQLMLLGLRRALVEEELSDSTRPFRRARVRVLEDRYSPLGALERPALQQRLLDSFGTFLPAGSQLKRQLDQLLGPQMPLGPLTDVLAFSIGFDVQFKQRLLAELDVDRRALMLLDSLPSAPASRGFPPEFSLN